MTQQKRSIGERGRSAKPTQTEIRTWWRTLKAKADAGDVKAIEALLRLSGQEKREPAEVHPNGM